MDDLLNQILNHLNNGGFKVKFGYSDPKKDGISMNILTTPIGINRYQGSSEKISRLTVYCLYDDFLNSFSTASQIYEFLSKNKIISHQLKILNVFGPTRVTFKQNKNLFIVEFELLGL